MAKAILRAFIEVTTAVAVLRCLWVFYGLAQMLLKRMRSGNVRWDLPMVLCIPEPFLLAATVAMLRSQVDLPTTASLLTVGLAGLGAVVSLAGFLVSQWAFHSYRSVGAGHYIDPDHQVVTSGAYGLVRHPLYLGAYLIWVGLALTFHSLGALVLFLIYVVPAYLAYMRSEEEMLLSSLGQSYASYQQRVPMLWPRRPRPAA